MVLIFTVFVIKNKNYCEELQEGKTIPGNKSLDELEANFKEILKGIDKIREEFPQIVSADFVSNTKEGIEKSKELIEEARKIANIADQINDTKNDEKAFS